nr:amidase family protein [Rhodoblastus sphagnicola]
MFEALWDRVLERNPPLNALIGWDESSALRAADESDKRLARRDGLPLDGLPLSIKDSFAVTGMPTTCGAEELADYMPEEDALAVARLRAAGAVIFAKSNVPRMTGDFQTHNALFGATSNPWDLSRSPGGSSGGAAAAVAAGLTAFELGSDLGGSIRWPAHGCGVFGLKTSWSQVPMLGHIPPLPSIKLKNPPDLGVAGPLARSAGDLELALSVIAGPVNASGPAFLAKPRRRRPGDWRVALWLDPNFAPVDAEVEQGVLHAADLLREAGARVEPAKPDFAFAEAVEIYALLNFAIGFAGAAPEVKRRAAEQAGGSFWLALRARAARMDAAAYAQLMTRRGAMKQAFADFFQRHDAILCPPAPCLAIAHDLTPDPFERRLALRSGDLAYHDLLKWACLAALAHLPAVVAPVAPGPSGLPRGVQIICPYDEDRSALALAAVIEEAGGGFRPPPFPFGTGA